MRAQRGFTMIELLVACGILCVLALLSIPMLFNSRIAANDASAVQSMRAINAAQVAYANAYPDIGFSPSLANLGPGNGGPASSSSANFLDNLLGCAAGTGCVKSGYQFYLSGGGDTYAIYTLPAAAGKTGTRSFYSDQSGVIRYNNDGAVPTVNDLPLQ
jgi:prepilin-type N-terminal cleavage/methylation domain-containing protein